MMSPERVGLLPGATDSLPPILSSRWCQALSKALRVHSGRATYAVGRAAGWTVRCIRYAHTIAMVGYAMRPHRREGDLLVPVPLYRAKGLSAYYLAALFLSQSQWLLAGDVGSSLCTFEVSNPSGNVRRAEPVSIRLGDLFEDATKAPRSLGVFRGDTRAPCQLDDLDGIPGPSGDDELCVLVDLPARGAETLAIRAPIPVPRSQGKKPVTVDAPWLGASARVMGQGYEATFLRRDYLGGTLHSLFLQIGERRIEATRFEGSGFGLLVPGGGNGGDQVLSFRDGLCGANDVESPVPFRCTSGPVRAVVTLDLAARHYRGSHFGGRYDRMYNPRLDILETEAVRLDEIPDVLLRKTFCFYPDGRIQIRKELVNRSNETVQVRGPVYASPHPFVFEFFLPSRPFVNYQLSTGHSGTLPSPGDPAAFRQKLRLDASGWIKLRDAAGHGATLAVRAKQLQLSATPHALPGQPAQIRFIGTRPPVDLPPQGRYGIECLLLIDDRGNEPDDRLASFFRPIQWRRVP